MIARTTRIAFEVAAGIVGVFVVLIGVAFWRLTMGPVPLDFLAPRIEQALSDETAGPVISIGTTELIWAGWDRTVDLVARDVQIRDSDGLSVAALPNAVIRLSLRALAHGIVAPTRVELHDVRLSVQRLEDGTFTFGDWEDLAADTAGDGESDLSRILPSVIEALLTAPTVEQPVSFLSALDIHDGRVFINDRRRGIVWQAPVANIELRRDAAGLAGDIGLAINIDGKLSHLAGGFVYDPTAERMDLSVGFAALRAEALASLAAQLEPLTGLSMPLDGSISASVGIDGMVDSLRLQVEGGAGSLDAPGFFPEALPVRRVALTGRVSGPDRRAEIESIRLSLGAEGDPGPDISASGTVTSSEGDFGGDLEIGIDALVSGLAMDRLARYWPEPVGVNERKWVLRNVPRGTVEQVSLQAELRIPGGDFDQTELQRIDGAFDYRDLEVHYLRPMPPVVEVSGTGEFDHATLTFDPAGGRLGGLEVKPSTVDISGLDTERQIMKLDLAVAGPLAEVLALLDHDRLQLIRRLDIDPAQTEGQVGARVQFAFPLLDDLGLDDIDIMANANLEQVGVRNFMLGQDATDGVLSLALDKTQMHLSGPLRLADIPIEVVWTESFSEKSRHRTVLQVQLSRLDEAGRGAFGLDLAPYLTGPVSASVVAKLGRDGSGSIESAINLQQAELLFDTLGWGKPAGMEGEAYFTLELLDQKPIALGSIDVAAGTLRMIGKGSFNPDGSALSALTLTELAFNGTSLTEVEVDLRGPGPAIRVGGGILDAEPFLGRDDDESDAEGQIAEADSGQAETDATADDAPLTPFSLSARRLDAVYFGSDRFLQNVDLDLEQGALGWERIALLGEVPPSLWRSAQVDDDGEDDAEDPEAEDDGAKLLRINFGPDESGGNRLLIKAEDMGAVLRALDTLDTVNGGRLEVVGQSTGPIPTHPLSARIEAHDYVVVDAPVLARLLTVASFTGIGDLLRGDGISFQRLVGEFTLQDGVMETELIRAYGPALGITAQGQLDFDRDGADLTGTVVPAYTVNRILGQIPLLGPLLTGGEGEGFIAVTYGISGELDDPKIEVNALSALAPGFLRGLFYLGGGDAEGEDAQPRALPHRDDGDDP